MKIVAQTAALQEALGLASSIASVRTPKPVLQCVKLIAGSESTGLTMLATDLETGCRCILPQVEIHQQGEALVPVQKFADIVRESSSEEVLTITADEQKCEITGSNAQFRLVGLDPGEFPRVAEFEGEGDFQVSSEVLSDLIEKTIFAVARVHSHYAISGVLWECSDKKLQLVSTDGHRLALARGSLQKSVSDDGISAIVPVKMMNLLQRAVTGSDGMLAVKLTDTQILIRTARAVLLSSLVQGSFPKYNDVIPRDCPVKVTVEREQFLHGIRQAALLTSEESHSVRLDFRADSVVLTGRSPEAGEAEVTVPVKLTGEPMEIAFNPTFLAEALKVAGVDEINMEMSAPNKPALLKGTADFLYVVMPVDLH